MAANLVDSASEQPHFAEKSPFATLRPFWVKHLNLARRLGLLVVTRPTLSGLADSLDFLRKERDRSDKSIGVSNVDRFWVYLHQRIRRMPNRL